MMEDDLKNLKNIAFKKIDGAVNLDDLEKFEIQYLGRKAGVVTEMLKKLKDLSDEEKRTVGPLANEVKKEIENKIALKQRDLSMSVRSGQLSQEKVDLTAPALPLKESGHFHPLSIVERDLIDLFVSMGFSVLDGPELESSFFNFSAINIPEDHPARDMQDTFYIKDKSNYLMRTHTSSMQVRAMRDMGVPLRVIVPGKCYRNEATDARHEHTFYQLEGFAVDSEITLAHMKGVLEVVAKRLYGDKTEVRLRPKYYPFVEPGVNGEVTCFFCGGKGCRVCKNTGWMEIFGAGMIHPNVLKEGGIDPKAYQGFAFGFGLTRLAMLKYDIDDVRIMESGDLRFIKQF